MAQGKDEGGVIDVTDGHRVDWIARAHDVAAAAEAMGFHDVRVSIESGTPLRRPGEPVGFRGTAAAVMSGDAALWVAMAEARVTGWSGERWMSGQVTDGTAPIDQMLAEHARRADWRSAAERNEARRTNTLGGGRRQ